MQNKSNFIKSVVAKLLEDINILSAADDCLKPSGNWSGAHCICSSTTSIIHELYSFFFASYN